MIKRTLTALLLTATLIVVGQTAATAATPIWKVPAAPAAHVPVPRFKSVPVIGRHRPVCPPRWAGWRLCGGNGDGV